MLLVIILSLFIRMNWLSWKITLTILILSFNLIRIWRQALIILLLTFLAHWTVLRADYNIILDSILSLIFSVPSILMSSHHRWSLFRFLIIVVVIIPVILILMMMMVMVSFIVSVLLGALRSDSIFYLFFHFLLLYFILIFTFL